MQSRSRRWPLSRLWRDGEEMTNKKNDDLGLPRHAKQAGQWQAASRAVPRRTVVARFTAYAFFLLLVAYGLYRFTKPSSDPSSNPPSSDPPRAPNAPPSYEPPRIQEQPPPIETANLASTKDEDREAVVRKPHMVLTDAISFPQLGQTILSITETGGGSPKNRNVLFAAASLQSAALLLPVACRMAAEHLNYVHFALASRSDVPMKELLKINGVDKSCPVIVHGIDGQTTIYARPDQANESTEARMALATARALYHINMFMHPQAIIVDASTAEEDYFLAGTGDQIKSTEATLIEIPDKAVHIFPWLTKLDSSGLAAWNKVHFDILIHAPLSGSGNTKRLLQSIAHADLSSVRTPHITLELPPVVETQLAAFLARYQWPPASSGSGPQLKMLSLRHRMPRYKLSAEESSVRFLESFWPNQPFHSHILVMSPHTEVTPQFFHYVKYALLSQRYSTIAMQHNWHARLFGISFSTPAMYLDNTKQFAPPKLLDEHKTEVETSFLWQAPNSDAVLIMGDRWVELHGYVSQLLEKQHAMSAAPELLAKKEVGKKRPSWLEYALQLSRLRGYFTIYPSQTTASAILGVHTDLYNFPEEYAGEAPTGQGERGSAVSKAMEMFDSTSQLDMLATLPNEGELLPIDKLPWLTWDGEETDGEKIETDAAQYRREFRRQVGQCEAEPRHPLKAGPHAEDLFCTTTAG